MHRKLILPVAMIWACPYTLLGVLIGTMGLCTGGRCRVRGCTLEFHGGMVKWFLRNLPCGPFVTAMTFGHTILGQTDSCLDVSREHELVHVRQYERWGPFFGPAYLFASLWQWINGRDAYRDNPFEREAYGD